MNLCHRYRTEEFLCGGDYMAPFNNCDFFVESELASGSRLTISDYATVSMPEKTHY